MQRIQCHTVWSWWLLFCSLGWSCPPLSRYPDNPSYLYKPTAKQLALVQNSTHSFIPHVYECVHQSKPRHLLPPLFQAQLSFGAVYVHNTDNPAHSMCLCETSSNYYIWQPNIMNVWTGRGPQAQEGGKHNSNTIQRQWWEMPVNYWVRHISSLLSLVLVWWVLLMVLPTASFRTGTLCVYRGEQSSQL